MSCILLLSWSEELQALGELTQAQTRLCGAHTQHPLLGGPPNNTQQLHQPSRSRGGFEVFFSPRWGFLRSYFGRVQTQFLVGSEHTGSETILCWGLGILTRHACEHLFETRYEEHLASVQTQPSSFRNRTF